MRLRISLLACAVLATACPRPPPPPPPPPSPPHVTEAEALTPEVKELSLQSEALLRDQDERVWKGWIEGTPINIAETYKGKEGLFSLASIRKIDRLRQLSGEPREIRALTHLHAYFVGEYLSNALAEPAEAIANLEASMTFTVEGREYAYRDLERLLANEKSTTKRHALYDGATPAVERLSQSLRRRQEKVTALLQELGYPSYEAFGAELREVNLDRLGALADQILQATQLPFVEVLRRLSDKELQLPMEKLRRADIPRLFRPHGVDDFFPKDALMPRAEATLKGLGIDLAAMKNLRIDARELATKNPRPLTLAVQVPTDVRTSIKPSGGVRDQAALMHELGYALHFGLSRETRFELAKLGGGAVSETFAWLFEDLTEDPVWLEEQAGMTPDKLAPYLAATSAHRLYQIRRAAGRLLYELQLRRREGQDPKALYSAIMTRTYGVPMTPADQARYLVDQEDFFESADSFQAWFLAAQLQGQLKARFGPAWWHSAQAGEFLRYLWAKGNSVTARELARMAGEEAIKPDVLLLRLGTALKVPITLSAAPVRELSPGPVPDTGSPADAGHSALPVSTDAGTAADGGAPDGGTPIAPHAEGDPSLGP